MSGRVAIGNYSAQSLLGVHVVLELWRVLEGERANVDKRVLLLELLQHVGVELLFFNEALVVCINLCVQ